MQPDNEGNGKPICYVSRSLSETEQKYSITEKEALAVVWCVEKLHLYLYHRYFDIIVDHHPLQFIFKNRNRASPRIERWQMKLQGYRYNITYKQGKKNIADFISRIKNPPLHRKVYWYCNTKAYKFRNNKCHTTFDVTRLYPK